MYNDRWFNGLSEEKKSVLSVILSEDNLILDRLKELCYNMLNELDAISNNFDSPNWAHRQASIVGEKKALKRIIALCSPAKEQDQVP